MKKFWVKVVPWNKLVALTALESGADALVLDKGFSDKAKELGLIQTVSVDGDLKLGQDVVEVDIMGKADEVLAAGLAKSKLVIVRTSDWSIIPLENLVAQSNQLIAEVKDSVEAKTALEVLEKGVSGVLLNSTNFNEIKRVGRLIRGAGERFELINGKITSINSLGSGDRVCVDTCTNMSVGQGMLVGNSSNGFFLVHSESVSNPYVEPRPFRVNAGAVHAYIKMPEGKTSYLSELKSGSEVLIVNSKGDTEVGIVGRVKIEKRPLFLVEAKTKSGVVSLVLQNAETIRLTNPDGNPISIVKLKKGDEVLCFVESSGRHFGMKIDERIEEK